MVFALEKIVRPNILALKPYRSARDDYNSGLLLDANENNFGPVSLMGDSLVVKSEDNPLSMHRYPDPFGIKVKEQFIKFRAAVPSIDNVFVGVGSDEVIDLVVRIFCSPGVDQILITPPTYGMYKVTSQINDVSVVSIPLTLDDSKFQLQTDMVLEELKRNPLIKVIWLCSPGNPTGSILKMTDIRKILDSGYNGIVVVDEAYIDFCTDQNTSAVPLINEYPNVLVMQTLSKSFGLAGVRIGFAISHKDIIQLMNNVKAPYNVNSLSQNAAYEALSSASIQSMKRVVKEIIYQRDNFLIPGLLKLPRVKKILGTNDANFVLVQFCNPLGEPDNDLAINIYKTLADDFDVVVRFRGSEPGCLGCLRITVGLSQENSLVISTLEKVINLLTSPQ
ncbi:Histidinol-phosphate aminotransferase [Smittium mucronatum]|uniref:histidinol-phosphate transaminase n=1 Tax=Smittium mucronatum TaxID=133383 RepID=A0A1R0GXV1_9FUNG|nr:Histidinol-phosphate aminotransferase [Smittium mucronatum]